MTQPRGLLSRIEWQEWHRLRVIYRTRRLRWNTWRLMNWYRVP